MFLEKDMKRGENIPLYLFKKRENPFNFLIQIQLENFLKNLSYIAPT
jgi:hypothetical protein